MKDEQEFTKGQGSGLGALRCRIIVRAARHAGRWTTLSCGTRDSRTQASSTAGAHTCATPEAHGRCIVEAWAFYRGVELDSDFKLAALLALFAGRELLNAAAI